MGCKNFSEYSKAKPMAGTTASRQGHNPSQAHLHFLECMDQINRVIHQSDDAEQMLWNVLDTAITIFGCDRIWLSYPCDPEAPTFCIPVEVTRPEYPGAYTKNLEIPMKPGADEICANVLAVEGPVFYTAISDPPIWKDLGNQFGVRSQMAMALYPRVGKPWMLGMHQCSHERVWTEDEQRLFEGVGRRIGEGLSTLLLLRDLRESQERFDLAVKGSGEGLWDWPDTREPAMWWAPRIYEMFGFEPGEITPSQSMLSEMIHPADRQRVQTTLQKHLQQDDAPYDLEFRLSTKSGEELWIHARGQSLRDESGQARRMSGSFHDVTERIRAAEELRHYRDHLEKLVAERTATLQTTNSKLEAANKELEAFSYSVSHDLRSPLTPIIGYADHIREHYRPQLDDQAIEMLSEITTQGEKMMSLMENLLALAQVGHLKETAKPEPVADILGEVIRDLKKEFADVAERVLLQEDLPSVHIQGTLLAQLFSNLIGNALRYAGRAGSPIEVSAERSGNRVVFSVRDHGPGIPKDEQTGVFNAFYRGSTGTNHKGTGLGLAIVAKIANSYGGKAWIEDTPGGGCTFRVEILDRPEK